MSTFHTYRKVTPTFARVLTEEDWWRRNGIIRTNEGNASFLPGDFLAHDAKGEWPITNANIRTHFQWTEQHENEHDTTCHFYRYLPLNTREACQMPEPFEVDGLHGKAGDYLVRSGKNEWVVDREIFEASYQLAE